MAESRSEPIIDLLVCRLWLCLGRDDPGQLIYLQNLICLTSHVEGPVWKPRTADLSLETTDLVTDVGRAEFHYKILWHIPGKH